MSGEAFGAMHVRIAVLRALYLNLPDAWTSGGYWYQAPTEPPASMLPTAPTTFGGPYTAVPTDGAYLLTMAGSDVTPREVPFIALGQTRQYDTGEGTDTQWRIVRVEVPIVVRVGISEVEAGARAALGIMEAYAETLCQAALTTTQVYMPGVARALDADNALGILSCDEVVTPPAIDLSIARSVPSAGHGSVTTDAACTLAVRQWQFRPVGTPGAPSSP